MSNQGDLMESGETTGPTQGTIPETIGTPGAVPNPQLSRAISPGTMQALHALPADMAEAQYVQWLSATNPTAQAQTIKALAWGIQEGQRRQEEQQRATEAAANVPSNSSGSAIRGTASTAGLLPGRADWETRKALLKDLVGIPEYFGQFKDDAARKWILACERHFQDVEGLTEVEISDTQKIIAAKSNLRKAAEDRWRVMYGRKSIQGMQWEEFKTWVEEQFSEYLSPEKRYAKYRRMTQGNQTPFHKYAADLRQAADDLEFRNMSEDLMIADLIHGAKADLQVRWHALPKHPTEWNAVVKAFVGLEEGATRGHAVSITGDPMDLSYMQGAPLGSTPGRKKEFKQTSEKKGEQSKPRIPRGRCFNCGLSGHYKRDCQTSRRKTQNTMTSPSGKVSGR
ncbi:hypothetical protein N7532_002324 [Penicillium argentinense]|uniref:CCHC-type domain-containing protein n=2 Tax=Penicillium argentinense TaxID=1131581 RepID=A0A9W9KK63_9EURO|nr:uncharacterized protein N7532_002324 [Penicillium argentinense]KAJ5109679.1 hypothetical protein N7532_002324 [Penicillium argentinense]